VAYGAVTVTTVATLILAANGKRLNSLIANNASQTVFLGPDSSVTTANGIPLQAGTMLKEDSGTERVWTGDVYGIVAATTADVRYWERTGRL
jgi:hypothetical protein